MPGRPAPTHDLIRLREPIALTVDAPVPAWVETALRRAPWAVVRRGHVRDGMIPVGVRGLARPQRFAAFLAVGEIADRLSPEDLTDSLYAIERARNRGRRIVAVGTTVVRALEGNFQRHGFIKAGEHMTDIFIRPGFRFQIVQAMVTNFHLPRSTLLALVSAFAGRERVLEAYREAIARGYRFYSFGDAMFLTYRDGK